MDADQQQLHDLRAAVRTLELFYRKIAASCNLSEVLDKDRMEAVEQALMFLNDYIKK